MPKEAELPQVIATTGPLQTCWSYHCIDNKCQAQRVVKQSVLVMSIREPWMLELIIVGPSEPTAESWMCRAMTYIFWDSTKKRWSGKPVVSYKHNRLCQVTVWTPSL